MFVDGECLLKSGPLARTLIPLPPGASGAAKPIGKRAGVRVNFAVNPGVPGGPVATASSSVSATAADEAIDGRLWFFSSNPNGWSRALRQQSHKLVRHRLSRAPHNRLRRTLFFRGRREIQGAFSLPRAISVAGRLAGYSAAGARSATAAREWAKYDYVSTTFRAGIAYCCDQPTFSWDVSSCRDPSFRALMRLQPYAETSRVSWQSFPPGNWEANVYIGSKRE